MFEFRKLGDPDPVVDEGSCRISGVLLQQLKLLQPGQVLRLTGEDGKMYGIANWDDIHRATSPTSGNSP